MNLLAIDTSTETLQLAVTDGQQVWQHSGPGGAQASVALIPALLTLLGQAGLRLPQLQAIAFGAGPGSFTGLRTACAVAQGLAFGLGLAVLPVDSLLALAEEAHHRFGTAFGARRVLAVMDARMDEVYAACYEFNSVQRTLNAGHSPIEQISAQLTAPGKIQLPEAWLIAEAGADAPAPWLLAGNAYTAYGPRLLGQWPAAQQPQACPLVLPSATAMLRLAPALLAQGAAVSPELAQPHYLRNRVAQTTLERQALHVAKALAQELPA